jgi:hypothetical protein
VAVTFTTGMAAVSGALGVLATTGDQIVAHQTLYSCTHSLLTSWLPRLGKSGDEELPGGLSAGEFVPDHAGGEPGADQDADREPIFHDACFASRRRKDSQRIATRRHPVVAGSGGLARHYCRIADLEDVLEAV